MACECCTSKTDTSPTARTLYRCMTVGGKMAKAKELIVADLCVDCREHEAGECPKCYVLGEAHVIVWQHAFVAHMAQFHNDSLVRLANTPEPPKPQSTSRYLGRVLFGKGRGL